MGEVEDRPFGGPRSTREGRTASGGGRGACYIPRPVIDFDHNATTSLHPEVAEAMARLQTDAGLQGNPSSVHARGRRARAVLEEARRRLAAALRAPPLGITFTSGGTEADNLAVRGLAGQQRKEGRAMGLASSRLEHPAVRTAVEAMEQRGHTLVWVAPDDQGRITADALGEALQAAKAAEAPVGVVSLAWANHELGNRYDIPELVARARAHDPEIRVHSDAVQALGKVPVDFGLSELDAMSVSSHKVRGPKGIGALVHLAHRRFDPLWSGGQQERGHRTGTENPISAMGFALAAELAVAELEARRERLAPLRARLVEGLAGIEGATVHGDPEANTANTVSASFAGCKGELLMMSLDLEGVCVSTGSACSAGTLEPSPVLLALGLDAAHAGSALRFSMGSDTQAAEVERVLELLEVIVPRVRGGAA